MKGSLSNLESGHVAPFPHRISIVRVYVCLNTETSPADLAGRDPHHQSTENCFRKKYLSGKLHLTLNVPLLAAIPEAYKGSSELLSQFFTSTATPSEILLIPPVRCQIHSLCSHSHRGPNPRPHPPGPLQPFYSGFPDSHLSPRGDKVTCLMGKPDHVTLRLKTVSFSQSLREHI